MILDKLLEFSDSQTVVAAEVGDAASTNVVDLVKPSELDNLHIVVQVQADCTSTGSATLKATLQTSEDEAFTAPVDLIASPAVALASLKKGKQLLKARIPYGVKQYLRVLYTVGTAVFTAGAVDAFLTPDVKL